MSIIIIINFVLQVYNSSPTNENTMNMLLIHHPYGAGAYYNAYHNSNILVRVLQEISFNGKYM